MSSVRELLEELIAETCQDGDEVAPQALLDALAATSDAVTAISDHDQCNDLFAILFEHPRPSLLRLVPSHGSKHHH